jgi:peptidoglycan hydrolase-like protein with peptidoglycan-binding domain
VQVELGDQYGYGLPVTGYYGTQTRAAVKDFQTKQGLAATGNANPPTWRALVATR